VYALSNVVLRLMGPIVDYTGQNPTWRQTAPYGAARRTANAWPDNRGFLDKPMNYTTGLTHVGAREYDPAVGRFISVDPLFDLKDPQSWNGYAYSKNSPVSASDPTGTRACDDDGSLRCKPVNDAPTKPQTKRRPWEKYAPHVLEVAKKTGLDPKMLLATFMIESESCFLMDNLDLCGVAQTVQKESTQGWFSLIPLVGTWITALARKAGQGENASIGYTNFDKQTFLDTQKSHPELANSKWEDLIGNPELSIDVMGYHMQDLNRALSTDNKSAYSRAELIRYGYRSTVRSMNNVATVGPYTMEPDAQAENDKFLKQYEVAASWINVYNAPR